MKARVSSEYRLKPITTELEHRRALATIDSLWDAPAGTRQADLLDVLVVLVEQFEEERFPFKDPAPIEAIRFRMEQSGRDRADLEQLLGSRSRVSEVLSGKRPLSLTMIRRLYDEWRIPLEALIPRSPRRHAAARR